MKKIHFSFPSSDQRTTLHGIRWEPDQAPKAVFQMVHGMAEYIDRFDGVAAYLCENGYAVIGHDHLGHGKSVVSSDNLGFFAEKNGDVCLLKDMQRITRIASKLYPDTPIFLFGHSMGSFLVRRYITLYPEQLAGAVICGTGDIGKESVAMGIGIADLFCRIFGGHHRSKVVEAMALGPMIASFGNKKRPGSWLSSDREAVHAYKEDPLCGFTFTVSAYRDFFRVIFALDCEKGFDRIPREMPILFMSGMDDALGGFTKKVLKLYNRFVEMRMKDVDVFFYPGERHEIVQGYTHEEVWAEVRGWLDQRV